METGRLIHPRVVLTPAGTFRMYYLAGNPVEYILSATSADGLDWTREPGFRASGQELCPLDPGIGPYEPLYDAAGRLLMYWRQNLCTASASSSGGWRSGIWEVTSMDGVNFSTSSFPATAALDGWIPAETYTGDLLTSRGFVPGDPAAVLTPNGIRVYFGLYQNPTPAVPPPETGIYVMLRTP
jgi:hypothetical protein